MQRFWAILSIIVFFSTVAGSSTYAATTKTGRQPAQLIVGYVENVSIPKIDVRYKAKLDTGAATSSMHATIIELKKKTEDEDGYVIFTIDTAEGESNHIKKPLERMVLIKKKEGGLQRRPVVTMTFCIAGRLIKDEVNLSDRGHFNYEVLVGRNMLTSGNLIIDASKAFTARPNCMAEEQDGV